MRRITQIRRCLSDIFNLRNDMVRAVDNRDEEALREGKQALKEELWRIEVEIDRGHAEDQEAMERET